MISNSALERRMTGQGDPRGAAGIMARGANVYDGGSMSAQSGGGPQFGRPPAMPPGLNGGGPPGLNGMMPPGMGGEIPGAPAAPMDPAGAPGPGMAPVESPMAPIVANMGMGQPPMAPPGMGDEMSSPSPSGETMNPILAALQQGGPPGNGGVGGNPSSVSPEVMAAIVRRLGAGGGSKF